MGGHRFESIRLAQEQSDLWIGWTSEGASGGASAGKDIEDFAARTLESIRSDIRAFGEGCPGFFETLEPMPDVDGAPEVVRTMLRAAQAADVGPMAAVAGAIAEAMGRALRSQFCFSELVVENGGDLWIDVRRPLTVAVYAGLSSLSETFGIVVEPESCPCGLACSSGTVGPSLSFGKADAAIVLSGDAAAADAWATSLGNRIHSALDLESAVRETFARKKDSADSISRTRGALVVLADKFVAAGTLRLAPLPPLRRGRSSGSI